MIRPSVQTPSTSETMRRMSEALAIQARIVSSSRMKRIALVAVVVLAAIACGVLAYLHPALRHPIVLAMLWRQPPASLLPVPVDGVQRAQLSDSWGSPRPGRRHHQGIDIFAKRGTPIRSTTAGIVMMVGDNHLGGHVVKVL